MSTQQSGGGVSFNRETVDLSGGVGKNYLIPVGPVLRMDCCSFINDSLAAHGDGCWARGFLHPLLAVPHD